MIEILNRRMNERDTPAFIRSKNGPEFVSLAILKRVTEHWIETVHNEPGKPWLTLPLKTAALGNSSNTDKESRHGAEAGLNRSVGIGTVWIIGGSSQMATAHERFTCQGTQAKQPDTRGKNSLHSVDATAAGITMPICRLSRLASPPQTRYVH